MDGTIPSMHILWCTCILYISWNTQSITFSKIRRMLVYIYSLYINVHVNAKYKRQNSQKT